MTLLRRGRGLKNPNHTKRGANITMDPIREPEKLREIRSLIKDHARNRLFFDLAVNNGLRVGDLLTLRVKDVRHLKAGEYISMRENKTKKLNILMINQTVYDSLQHYLEKMNPADNDFLFHAQGKPKRPLTTQLINMLIKKWTAGLNGSYGCHTLRKTFGYHQRVHHGVALELLMKRFNHLSPTTTLRYCGVEDREVNGILLNEI